MGLDHVRKDFLGSASGSGGEGLGKEESENTCC